MWGYFKYNLLSLIKCIINEYILLVVNVNKYIIL